MTTLSCHESSTQHLSLLEGAHHRQRGQLQAESSSLTVPFVLQIWRFFAVLSTFREALLLVEDPYLYSSVIEEAVIVQMTHITLLFSVLA